MGDTSGTIRPDSGVRASSRAYPGSPGIFADTRALRGCWHPVAFSADLAERPVHADLLGEPLVLWRGSAGRPRVMSDLCVHRGTALSLGWVSGEELVCAYHGWRYGADGRCVAIPQLEDPGRVPARARVAAFAAQERYGLIWVALEEPRWPLPEVPELEDSGWAVVSAGPPLGGLYLKPPSSGGLCEGVMTMPSLCGLPALAELYVKIACEIAGVGVYPS